MKIEVIGMMVLAGIFSLLIVAPQTGPEIEASRKHIASAGGEVRVEKIDGLPQITCTTQR